MCYEYPLSTNSEIKIQAGQLLIGPAEYLGPALLSLVNLATVVASCDGQAGSVIEPVSHKTGS